MLMFSKSRTMKENNISEVQSLALDKIDLPTRTPNPSANATVASYGQLKEH